MDPDRVDVVTAGLFDPDKVREGVTVQKYRGGETLQELDRMHRRQGADLDSWTLEFPLERNPLSMNGSRGSHYGHNRTVRGIRLTAKSLAQTAGIPHLEHCRVALTWYVRTAGRRDPVNLSALLKAMQDGLVDAGVVPDDTPDLMDTAMPRIVRVDKLRHATAWMELVVTRWDGTFS